MPDTGADRPSNARSMSRLGTVIALVSVLGVLALVSAPVSRNIKVLATANSDNVQWTLAQVEVEYFALKSALSQDVGVRRAQPEEIRRRFDIFYSRIGTLEKAQVFAVLREDVGFREALDEIRAFLDAAVPVIDADDAVLSAARPDLLEDIMALRGEVRAMALGGIERFAELSDERRVEVLETLRLTAGLVFALVGVLLLALVILLQLFQDGARQARALRQTTSRLDAIVSNAVEAILVTDCSGRVLDYDGAAEHIFGHAREGALGRDMLRALLPDLPEGPHGDIMAEMAERGRARVEAMRRGGDRFPAEMAVTPVRSETGDIFITFLRDISEQEAADDALRRARDAAIAGEKAKADLLAVMSHEMRTPLNGILGTLDLIGQTDLTGQQADYVRNMLTSGQLLLHHVSDVLEIARLEAGTLALSPDDFELCALLDDLAQSQRPSAAAQGNVLDLTLPPGEGPVWLHADAMRLRQVLLNLIGNAIKFTRNGRITLSAERVAPGMLEFSVKDTGIGIPPEDHARVFEDFVTLDASYGRQTEGTGLGLGITRRIVSAMGGEIALESEAGKGALFRVRLPLAEVPAPAPRPEAPVAENARAPGRSLDILLVEDNAINRSVAVSMLTQAGHRVSVASDGEEGVQAAAARRFDLILMDISMPRLDGVAATRQIGACDGPNTATPIVALTANALPSDVARFREAGMADVLTKPIRAHTLTALMARWQGGDDRHAPVLAPEETKTRPDETPLAPDTPDCAADPDIDCDVLTELHAVMGSARIARLLEQIDLQLQDAAASLPPSPQTAIDSAERVHKAAGAVAMLGCTGLHADLQKLERDLRAGRRCAPPEVFQAKWAATRAIVKEFISEDEVTAEASG